MWTLRQGGRYKGLCRLLAPIAWREKKKVGGNQLSLSDRAISRVVPFPDRPSPAFQHRDIWQMCACRTRLGGLSPGFKKVPQEGPLLTVTKTSGIFLVRLGGSTQIDSRARFTTICSGRVSQKGPRVRCTDLRQVSTLALSINALEKGLKDPRAPLLHRLNEERQIRMLNMFLTKTAKGASPLGLSGCFSSSIHDINSRIDVVFADVIPLFNVFPRAYRCSFAKPSLRAHSSSVRFLIRRGRLACFGGSSSLLIASITGP